MKKIILFVLCILVLVVILVSGMELFNSEDTPAPQEPTVLNVKSTMRRYGPQESIVISLENSGENDIVFPDSQYGMKLYRKQNDGLWSEVISSNYINSRIHAIGAGDVKEVIVNHRNLEVGEYRAFFEGWLKKDYSKFIKGGTTFEIYPYPTFKVDVLVNSLKPMDYLSIVITNDRLETIVFADSTLSLELYILNEKGEWMKLPSPLFNDQVPFELLTGQNYQLQLPPLRAKGDYKVIFSGHEVSENDLGGIKVVAEIELEVK